MKKYILTAAMLTATLVATAVPARRGQWTTIQLADGGTARVQAAGDEFMHFMLAEDGTRYVADAQTGLYRAMTPAAESSLQHRSSARRAAIAANTRRKAMRHEAVNNEFQDQKKALVILAEFTDVKFKSDNNLELYRNAINGIGYESGNFHGSVRDYFRAQSNGQFDIDFDVVGVCPLTHSMAYYGQNGIFENDLRPGEMVAEACNWAHSQGVDFSKYDWNGDGEVEEVYVVYAGYGEADNYPQKSNTIWPHMFYLSESDYGQTLTLDGMTIDTYACSSELQADGRHNGIGTFCHEFSHCMGYPDLYDTNYSGWFGMGKYDLMDQGSYNGDGFKPVGYSAYEKNECGWITMHDMTGTGEATTIADMKPISEYGDAYVVRNQGNSNEYYIVEYRRRTNWDSSLPGEGVMITHVDYDKDIWYNNMANTRGTYYAEDDIDMKYPMTNDHQRLTLFHANNKNTTANALYPYKSNNSLTRTSSPAATLYNANADGSKYMHIDIKDIAANGATASVTFAPAESTEPDTPVTPVGDNIFYESFDKCNGKGGNDGLWNGNIGSSVPAYEEGHTAWTSSNSAIYAAYKCLKLGTGSKAGTATSPSFALNGTATLTFKAGAWNSSKDGTELTVNAANATLANSSFSMDKGAWTEFTTTITGKGNVRLTFETNTGRFFLDEVRVGDTSTGIESLSPTAAKRVAGYYTIDGLRLDAPRKGICIIRYTDGTTCKKIMK